MAKKEKSKIQKMDKKYSTLKEIMIKYLPKEYEKSSNDFNKDPRLLGTSMALDTLKHIKI